MLSKITHPIYWSETLNTVQCTLPTFKLLTFKCQNLLINKETVSNLTFKGQKYLFCSIISTINLINSSTFIKESRYLSIFMFINPIYNYCNMLRNRKVLN